MGVQESIDFIEHNLSEVLDIEEIAGKAALSAFYYQRIFGALCGMTVGEYIRARRMTLAAQELSVSDARVIDIAVKYGYDSPDSLQKVNMQIWSEWLPSLTGYELAGNYSIEIYMPPAENPADTINYIWIPLKKL